MTANGPQGQTAFPAEVADLCAITGLSRASFLTRLHQPKLTKRDDADLCDVIQRLALQRRNEGDRRMTRRLRDEGLVVNAKRVLRLFRRHSWVSPGPSA